MRKYRFLISLISILLTTGLFAGTTGKIRGIITSDSGQPLPGANILVDELSIGAASADDGSYFILNVPPGKYTVSVHVIGYKIQKVRDVNVSSDLTTTLDAQLEVTVLESGEEVTVYSRQRMIQRDATASAAIISSDVIEDSPIETFQAIVQTKAGVSVDADGNLHFRGGRADEITYLIDGIPNVNAYHSEVGIDIATNAIQELSVITGAFSAEYGQAMSGIVNIVTKDPGRKFNGSFSFMAGDIWTDYDIDLNPMIQDEVQAIDFSNSTEIEATISGPIPILPNLRFFASMRTEKKNGYFYGVDQYLTSRVMKDTSDWEVFSMNPSDKINLQAKLLYYLGKNIKLHYNILSEDYQWQTYYHTRKWTDAGRYTHYKDAMSHFLKMTHQLNYRTFYSLGFSKSSNNYEFYAYKDPLDERYLWEGYYRADVNYEFYNGGTRNSREDRQVSTNLLNGQLTSQIGQNHELKTGFEVRLHEIYLHTMVVFADRRDEPFEDTNNNSVYDLDEEFIDLDGNGEWTEAKDDNNSTIIGDVIIPEEGAYNSSYRHKPQEFSAYIQDKIELQDMVLNLGIRWDYYEPDGNVAQDWTNPDPSMVEAASAKSQISPRFSIAYPITDRGKLFFSYGHFFQMPPYFRLYHNPDFDVLPGVIKSDIGNADLKPQKTVSYEVGFEQEISNTSAIYAKLFYRDMRNLLGQRVYILPGGSDSYALFINRDWGNVKGVTLSFDQRFAKIVSGSVDYTYEVAVGNESDPTSTRLDFRLNIDPHKKVVPLDWNQTHAFRFVFNLGIPGNWRISTIGRIESGYPYTPADINAIIRVAQENSGKKPTQMNIDVNAYKNLEIANMNYRIFVKVYNLLDRRNENLVHDSSGRAGYSLGRYGDEASAEWINRPHYFSKPREVFFGIEVDF
ncbi:MAG: TonB-dependent receptor [Candidatus Marinimicrobia bacterium]|nr:TonB-dependent receptor [Candidatus Neomarinimicrobiota bacterium]